MSCWARASGANVSPVGIARLRATLAILSASWRAAGLPKTPKLHVAEAYLADAIERHQKWGAIDEHGAEALHKIGVDADERCFGANENDGLAFFVRRQLAITLADATRFEARKKMAPSAVDRDTSRELDLCSLARHNALAFS